MPRYMVNIDDKEYDIELIPEGTSFQIKINNLKHQVESYKLGDTRSVLILNNNSNEIDIRSNGIDNKRTVFLRGQEIQVEIENYNLAQLRKKAGMSSGSTVEKLIKSPMPGLIVEVKVSAGDTVAKGQPLIIIEAMKMENMIKSPTDGIIKNVFTEKNKSVEKDDKLVEFE